MADDWFRTAAWDDEARADFERRLARARPWSRSQYLTIKAVCLTEAGERDGARTLLDRAVDCADDDLERLHAWELLADLAVEDGDTATAEELYRRCLADPTGSGTSGAVAISLAELLVARGTPEALDEADDLLGGWNDGEPAFLHSQAFRWNLAAIALNLAVGDHDGVRSCAAAALDLADAGPMLPRKPTVGVVVTDEMTLARLRRLAR